MFSFKKAEIFICIQGRTDDICCDIIKKLSFRPHLSPQQMCFLCAAENMVGRKMRKYEGKAVKRYAKDKEIEETK